MFTGIVEERGEVTGIKKDKKNIIFSIRCSFAGVLKKGQSISHNGTCLTVEKITPPFYRLTAIDETLKRTNLKNLKAGGKVNLERAVKAGGRMDGHFVQGHVDCTAVCKKISDAEGSKIFTFHTQKNLPPYVVEKGSICIDGVSLTVVSVKKKDFIVAIIPHTLSITTFGIMAPGYEANIEFDILGKYVDSILQKRRS
ncbi:MAG: riboflavin synthase [Bacteroidetes bacterium]|nr:riboflavin synthase [Bacteroidota bacterium]